jgi:hypothetical protein
LSGGRFLLRWHYTHLDEEVAATEFRIYIDSGEGFDFNTPAEIISYDSNLLGGDLKWTSDAYPHGQRVKFCVRAYAEDKGETQNTDYVSAVADHLGPEAITDIYATMDQLP